MSKWGLCLFFFFLSFFYLFFFLYQWQSGALIRYKYLLKKYFKATTHTVDNIVLLPKKDMWTRAGSKSRWWGGGCMETVGIEIISGPVDVFIIYYTHTCVGLSLSHYWRVDEHWEIFYLLPLCPPHPNGIIFRSVCTVHYIYMPLLLYIIVVMCIKY